MCCTWFAHDCARATWAYVLDTGRCTVRRLSKISYCVFEWDDDDDDDYYYYLLLLLLLLWWRFILRASDFRSVRLCLLHVLLLFALFSKSVAILMQTRYTHSRVWSFCSQTEDVLRVLGKLRYQVNSIATITKEFLYRIQSEFLSIFYHKVFLEGCLFLSQKVIYVLIDWFIHSVSQSVSQPVIDLLIMVSVVCFLCVFYLIDCLSLINLLKFWN